MVPLRKFLTSADVAKALGVPKTNLFLWEDKKKIPKARRDPMSGYRIYTREDVEKIRKIITRERVRSIIIKSIRKGFK